MEAASEDAWWGEGPDQLGECSYVTPVGLFDSLAATALCEHLAFASVGVEEHAGHWEGLGLVDAAASVGGGVQRASVGWGMANRGQTKEVQGEKLKMEEVRPGGAQGRSLASSEVADGVQSFVESGSLEVPEVGEENRSVDVAEADLEKPADNLEAEMEYTQGRKLAELG